MRDLLEQIQRGLELNLYYLSLFVALTIPGICGAMASEDGLATGDKYKNWFDQYVAPKYHVFLTAEDCYLFRCSVLHQGTTQHPRSGYSRIVFVEPSVTKSVLHCNILNDALNIDVRVFCNDIIEGAKLWLQQNEQTEIYRKNCDKFSRRYPNGLSPYIVGVPVIG